MRSAAAVLTALLLLVPAPRAQDRSTKLLVIVVVDQMRADYVDRFQKDWTGGFKRMVTGGAVFHKAAYPYLTTVTCAGHATISTGSLPHSHGIIQNAWWDRETGAMMTCTQDPRSAGIGYGAAVHNGDSPWRLQRPALADVMRAERGAHVVTVSLKDRSAIMLAGHGGDAVTWLNEGIGSWQTSSAFTAAEVPAVKAFIDANTIKSDFGKTWSLLLPRDKYREPDDGEGEAPPPGWTRTFPHVLSGTGNAPDVTFVAQWERSPYSNDYLGRFAAALVDAFSLGRHDGTDVLGVSFSAPDLVGHGFGPFSLEEHDLYMHLDRTLGALFERLDASVGEGRWVAALTADHGVTAIPEQLKAQGHDSGRLTGPFLAAMIEERLRTSLGDGKYVAQVNGNDIYFAPGVYEKLLKTPRVLDAVIQRLRETPGIARVFRGEELRDAAAAKDATQRAAALGYFPGRSGDLMVALKPGWMFSATGTTHGTANADDQRVPVMFFGAGVKPGRYGDVATPADVAPTLAAIAGVKLSNIDGRVLDSALAHSSSQ